MIKIYSLNHTVIPSFYSIFSLFV